MGLLDFFRGVPRITQDQIPEATKELDRRLQAQRDAFIIGSRFAHESAGFDVSFIPKHLEIGTELDSLLRGYQLAAVVEYVTAYYLREVDRPLAFWIGLSQYLDNGNSESIVHFQNSYLNCGGDSERVARKLAQEIHRIWGAPEPRDRVLNGLNPGAAAFMIMTLSCAAGAFGDIRNERKFKKIVGL